MKNKLIIAALFATLSSSVMAESVINNTLKSEISQEKSVGEKLWISPGMVSYHFDRDMGFNESNEGLGIEYEIDKNWSFAAGRFKNSEYNHSNYITVAYQPIQAHGFKLGVVGGIMDGYMGIDNKLNKDPFPMLLPVVSYEYKNVGVNLMVIPEANISGSKIYGAVGLQFKFKAFNF